MQVITADQVLWILTDAFCGTKVPTGTVIEKPALLGTFPRFGIKDRTEYVAWLSRQIAADPPTTIVPCHGSLISGSTVGDAVRELVTNM